MSVSAAVAAAGGLMDDYHGPGSVYLTVASPTLVYSPPTSTGQCYSRTLHRHYWFVQVFCAFCF